MENRVWIRPKEKKKRSMRQECFLLNCIRGWPFLSFSLSFPPFPTKHFQCLHPALLLVQVGPFPQLSSWQRQGPGEGSVTRLCSWLCAQGCVGAGAACVSPSFHLSRAQKAQQLWEQQQGGVFAWQRAQVCISPGDKQGVFALSQHPHLPL